MASISFRVNSNESMIDACNQGVYFWREHKYIQVKFSDVRSLDQNSLLYYWLDLMEKQGSYTAAQYRNKCKYQYGVKIVWDKPEFSIDREVMKSIDWQALGARQSPPLAAVEVKEAYMSNIQISSLMSTDEMKSYLKAIHDHYCIVEGMYLPSKKDLIAEAKRS